MRRFIVIISLAVLFFSLMLSCSEGTTVYNHENDIVELGGNYYFLGDGRESQILRNLKPLGKPRYGKAIIPAEVLRYNFNENYIISETKGITDGKYYYWIINKRKILDSIHPVDSMLFFKKTNGFGLKLKPR